MERDTQQDREEQHNREGEKEKGAMEEHEKVYTGQEEKRSKTEE